MKRLTAFVFTSLFGFLVSCNSSGGRSVPDAGKATQDAAPMSCGDAGTGTSFPCDVAPIIAKKCQRCHDIPSALSGCLANTSCLEGPFPLRTWSDTRRDIGIGVRVIDLLPKVIEKDVMPYQTDSIQPPVEMLTPAEKATLLDWARSCAPAAATACSP